jgi:NADPH:quinone reductase-like Zn-dependent oxidoreductase
MPRAVRFDHYGGIDVLNVVEVPRPVAADGELLVAVKAAGINPGEAKIRDGLLHEIFPATFPSGEGSDLAGVVEEVGPGVTAFAPGDEVIGFTDSRASHAELVIVEAANAVPRPPAVPWEVAGSLFVAGTTAYAMVRAVAVAPGDVVAFAGATGGVGSIAVQLAKRAGATVIGIAGESHRAWLSSHGIDWVPYGEGIEQRLRSATTRDGRFDAMLDASGEGYVELALKLGVAPDRIDTIADFAAVQEYGVKGDGTGAAASAAVLRELAGRVADGELEVPIAATYPLDEVREAYRALAEEHPLGKIALMP